MPDYFRSQKEKLSFREIALGHLKKILELSCVEFRSGYLKTVFQNGTTIQEYVPSSIKSYCQSIEHFGYVLIPHFDKSMDDVFDKFVKDSKDIRRNLIEKRKERLKDDFEFAVRKAISNKTTAPREIDLEENLRKALILGSHEDKQLTQSRLVLCEKLFCDLNRLLKRIDYLKSSVYSESDLDDGDDEILDTDEKKK